MTIEMEIETKKIDEETISIVHDEKQFSVDQI